jgi:hypothetical protein
VIGSGHLNAGKNNNRGIASASANSICTCGPNSNCVCSAEGTGRRKLKKVTTSNEPTTLPSYSNITTTQFTQLPRDPNVSAERGKIFPLSRIS